MKKIILLASVLFLSLGSMAQNIINKQFVLIDYNLDISDEFREQTETLHDFFQSAEVHNEDAEDRLKAILVHDLYYKLKPRLEKNLKISILPVNFFMQKADYDEFGYPDMGIGKAQRKGDSPFYFNVLVTLNSKELEENSEPVVHPHFAIDMKVFNDEGILPVYKWHGEKGASDTLPVSKNLFKGFVNDIPQAEEAETNLSFLYDKAILDLINNHLNE